MFPGSLNDVAGSFEAGVSNAGCGRAGKCRFEANVPIGGMKKTHAPIVRLRVAHGMSYS